MESADVLISGDTLMNALAERTADVGRKPAIRRRMLATPIPVTTIDTLMSAANARGGGHLGGTLRVASSDLVTDGIGSFSPGDIITISRLVRIAAFHGRSVIKNALAEIGQAIKQLPPEILASPAQRTLAACPPRPQE